MSAPAHSVIFSELLNGPPQTQNSSLFTDSQPLEEQPRAIETEHLLKLHQQQQPQQQQQYSENLCLSRQAQLPQESAMFFDAQHSHYILNTDVSETAGQALHLTTAALSQQHTPNHTDSTSNGSVRHDACISSYMRAPLPWAPRSRSFSAEHQVLPPDMFSSGVCSHSSNDSAYLYFPFDQLKPRVQNDAHSRTIPTRSASDGLNKTLVGSPSAVYHFSPELFPAQQNGLPEHNGCVQTKADETSNGRMFQSESNGDHIHYDCSTKRSPVASVSCGKLFHSKLEKGRVMAEADPKEALPWTFCWKENDKSKEPELSGSVSLQHINANLCSEFFPSESQCRPNKPDLVVSPNPSTQEARRDTPQVAPASNNRAYSALQLFPERHNPVPSTTLSNNLLVMQRFLDGTPPTEALNTRRNNASSWLHLQNPLGVTSSEPQSIVQLSFSDGSSNKNGSSKGFVSTDAWMPRILDTSPDGSDASKLSVCLNQAIHQPVQQYSCCCPLRDVAALQLPPTADNAASASCRKPQCPARLTHQSAHDPLSVERIVQFLVSECQQDAGAIGASAVAQPSSHDSFQEKVISQSSNSPILPAHTPLSGAHQSARSTTNNVMPLSNALANARFRYPLLNAANPLTLSNTYIPAAMQPLYPNKPKNLITAGAPSRLPAFGVDAEIATGRCFEPRGPKPLMHLLKLLAHHQRLTCNMLSSLLLQFLPTIIQRVQKKIGKINKHAELYEPLWKQLDPLMGRIIQAIIKEPSISRFTNSIAAVLNQTAAPRMGSLLVEFLRTFADLSFEKRSRIILRVADALLPVWFDLLSGCTTAGRDEKIVTSVNLTDIVHHGSVCLHCLSRNIVGPRFRCLDCPNYNLCGECFITHHNFHDENHGFQCLLRDVRSRGANYASGYHKTANVAPDERFLINTNWELTVPSRALDQPERLHPAERYPVERHPVERHPVERHHAHFDTRFGLPSHTTSQQAPGFSPMASSPTLTTARQHMVKREDLLQYYENVNGRYTSSDQGLSDPTATLRSKIVSTPPTQNTCAVSSGQPWLGEMSPTTVSPGQYNDYGPPSGSSSSANAPRYLGSPCQARSIGLNEMDHSLTASPYFAFDRDSGNNDYGSRRDFAWAPMASSNALAVNNSTTASNIMMRRHNEGIIAASVTEALRAFRVANLAQATTTDTTAAAMPVHNELCPEIKKLSENEQSCLTNYSDGTTRNGGVSLAPDGTAALSVTENAFQPLPITGPEHVKQTALADNTLGGADGATLTTTSSSSDSAGQLNATLRRETPEGGPQTTPNVFQTYHPAHQVPTSVACHSNASSLASALTTKP